MNFLIVILVALGWFFGQWAWNCFKPRFCKVPQERGWLLVSDHSIPESIRDFYFFDGARVDYCISVKYNSREQHVNPYNNRVITHWMKAPTKP